MFIADNKWCFIHIPKTSGTNLTTIFPKERIVKYDDSNCWDNFWADTDITDLLQFMDPIKSCNISQHAPVYFWENIGILSDQKIFTIVRNPYARFFSWYQEMMRIINFFNLPFKHVSFEEFIDPKCQILPLEKFPYNSFTNYTNQIDYLMDKGGNPRVDRVYKMESDLNLIEKDFNITGINTFKINSLPYDKNYSKFYTSKMIDWVKDTFKKDFEYFEYDLKPFWL